MRSVTDEEKIELRALLLGLDAIEQEFQVKIRGIKRRLQLLMGKDQKPAKRDFLFISPTGKQKYIKHSK